MTGAGWARRRFLASGVVCLALLLSCACCSKGAKTSHTPSQSGQQEADLKHIVKWQGETLSAIAKWYTEASENWAEIAKVNPSIKPNRILIGDIIIIPAALVKNREPLPEKFLRKCNKKPTACQQKSARDEAAGPEQDSGPDLFGPKPAPPTGH